MKKVKLHYIFSLFLLFATALTQNALSANESIETIQSLEEIKSQFEDYSQDTLVVFDVDDVLTMHVDQFWHPDSNFRKLFYAEEKRPKTPAEKDIFEKNISVLMLQPQRVLVENTTPNIIKQLQKKGIKVIALTNCATGQFGHIASVEEWRITQLRDFDIDFSKGISVEKHHFLEIAKPNLKPALFEKGILFSQGYTKGEVLEAFLKVSHWKPGKIVLIDDQLKNHETVEKHLNKLGIPFKGYHYHGVKAYQNKMTIEQAMVEYQFRTLIEHGKWVNDKQVKKIFSK